MKKCLYSLFISVALLCQVKAQTEIYPNSDSYKFNLQPFVATYSQMGAKLHVETRLSADGKMYNVTMSMPDFTNRSRVITDVIGISAEDGSFVYRDFHFFIPSRSYNKASYQDNEVQVSTYEDSGLKKESVAAASPVFDGTFVYWQLSGVKPSIKSFPLHRWKKGPQGLEAGMSSAFTHTGSDEVTVGSTTYTCNIYEAEAANGVKVVSFVADQAPYLVKQQVVQGSNPPTTVLELSNVMN